MQQVTSVFPSAQRALFQKYHVGGCSSCGFQPTDTLAAVATNHGLDINEVVQHIQRSQEMEQDLEITPREAAELLKQGKIKLLDVRTPEEYANREGRRKCADGSEVAQEIMQTWPKDTADCDNLPSRNAQSRCRRLSPRPWIFEYPQHDAAESMPGPCRWIPPFRDTD